MNTTPTGTGNPWEALRACTPARIALGRTGGSLPTREVLRFGLAHAQACDAVHQPLDVATLERELQSAGLQSLRVASRAPDRASFLLRPDLGRRLTPAARALLERAGTAAELVVVVADGLSAIAVQRHAPALLREFCTRLPAPPADVPVVVAEQGRVALGDDIGEALGAALAIVLIGERPGLSAADSLGIYLTFAPRIGRMDSERNCISNVRPDGLGYAPAAERLAWLVRESLRRRLSGIALKDDSATDALGLIAPPDCVAASANLADPTTDTAGSAIDAGCERR